TLSSLVFLTMNALKEIELDELLPYFFASPIPDWAERENHYSAGRLGLEAPFLLGGKGNVISLEKLTKELLKALTPFALELNEVDELKKAHHLLLHPPYREIIALYEKNFSFQEIMLFKSEQLMKEIGQSEDYQTVEHYL